MPAAQTFTFIAKYELESGTTTSFSFTSIPNTYDFLYLYTCLRIDRASSYYDTYMRFNDDAGANYSWTYGGSETQSSLNTGTSNNVSILRIGACNAANSTSNVFASGRHIIGSYKDTSSVTTMTSESAAENMSTANISSQILLMDGFYKQTATVTKITIFPADNNFVAGTSAYLYGITNA